MRHLRTISYLITAAGIVAVIVSLVSDVSPTVQLVGLMLVIAGAVKIGMVALWNGVAGFGAPALEDPPGSQIRTASDSPSRRRRM